MLSFLVEFICLHSFTIFSVTILDELYLLVFVLQILVIFALLSIRILLGECRAEPHNGREPNSKQITAATKRQIIKAIFLNVLISTTIMILAVDFRVFPRRNGKIEHFGLGLMDAGAICFLGINAVISPEVRLLSTVDGFNASSKLKVFRKNAYSCCKLLIVGLIRLLTIKNLNYQEHVSEYGVHMNFFLVLVLIKLLGMAMSLAFNRLVFHPLFGLSLICLHEILLKQFGLSDYLQQDGHRHSFLDKNKESFFTMIAYVGFYLSCFNLPGLLDFEAPKALSASERQETRPSDVAANGDQRRYQAIRRLLGYALFYFVMFRLGDSLSERISRRNMNMAFTCLTLSLVYLIGGLEILWAILYDRFYADRPPRKNSKSYSAADNQPADQLTKKPINQSPDQPRNQSTNRDKNHPSSELIIQNGYTNNGLIAFLLSNVLTGFVNMSTNTMQTGDLNAIILLFAYSFVVAISVCFLDSLHSFY